MAEKKNLEKQVPTNVVPLGSSECKAEGCKKKQSRAGFCEEHFEWFKMGLITKEGLKASDFDKKFHHYESQKNKKKSA